MREHADPHVSCILVGNKVDLCEDPTPSAAGLSLTSSSPPNSTAQQIRSVRGKNTASQTVNGKLREVTHEEAEQWAKEEGMLFVEASAKSGKNVERAFVDASRNILEKIKQGVFDDDRVRLLPFLWRHALTCVNISHPASNFQFQTSQLLGHHAVFRSL